MKTKLELIAKLSRLVRLLHLYDLTAEQCSILEVKKIALEDKIKSMK